MSCPPDYDGEPIWQMPRYQKQAIARERRYRGTVRLDIREWLGDDGERATKRGISIPLEGVRGLGQALLAYAKKLDGTARDSSA